LNWLQQQQLPAQPASSTFEDFLCCLVLLLLLPLYLLLSL